MEEAEIRTARPRRASADPKKPVWKEFIRARFLFRPENATRTLLGLHEKGVAMAANNKTANAGESYDFTNTNKWDTRQLVTMALMCAIASLLSFIQIPLIPGVTFLTYDPSLMPAMVCGFAFGPGAGIAVGCIAAVIHGLILGEWVGSLMNIVVTLCFVWPAAALYARNRTYKWGIIGLIIGVVTATAGAIAANLTIGVAFWYGSVDVILPMLLPAVLPFNLLKGAINAVLTLVVYKAISNLITPKKSQVKGH